MWLYTHGSGTELPETVRIALSKHKRWDDQPYLTRMIFGEMTRNAYSEETGFGITAYPTDGVSRQVIVDVGKQTVTLQRADFGGKIEGTPARYTFDEYVALLSAEWPER